MPPPIRHHSRNTGAAACDLDDLVLEAEEQMADLDSEIFILQEKVQKLQLRKLQLKAFTFYCTNRKAPVSRLAPEIMLEIFSHILPDIGVYIGCSKSFQREKLDIFRLGSVCHSWRNLLLSHPLFWSKVVLSIPHSEASITPRTINSMTQTSLGRLNLCYRRSRDTLMSLTILTGGPPPSDLFSKVLLGKIAFGARRWENVHVGGILFDMFPQLGQVEYPNLRSLSLKNRGGYLTIGLALQTFGLKAPNLSSISLDFDKHNDSHNLRAVSTLIATVGSQLTRFNLVIAGQFWREDAVHLHEAVALMPGLSDLKIHLLAKSWRVTPEFTFNLNDLPPLLLPGLLSLDLKWESSAKLLSPFFFRLVPPNLQHLSFELNGTADEETTQLLEWADNFSQSLRSASLIFDHWQASVGTVLSLAQRFTSLSTLTLRGQRATTVFRALSGKDKSGRCFAYVPKLTRLVVHLREDAKDPFLKLVTTRTSAWVSPEPSTTAVDGGSTGLHLESVKIHAPRALVLRIHPELLSIIRSVNYALRVEYEVDYEPWLNIGFDGSVQKSTPSFAD